MSKIGDYRSSPAQITGSSTINHEIRVKLQLTCSEYVLIDHMHRKELKGEMADTLSVYVNTGFTEQNQELLVKSLIAKGFIRIEQGQVIKLTSKYEDAFPNLDKEFEEFWIETLPDKGDLNHTKMIRHVAWTGTKKKALEYWHKLRKKHTFDYLMAQRSAYFEYLELEHKRGFARQRMMCQVFLNPGSERYMEDYADYAKQLKIKLGLLKEETKIEVLSSEQRKEFYAKNNNK